MKKHVKCMCMICEFRNYSTWDVIETSNGLHVVVWGVYKCKYQKRFVACCCSFDSPTKLHAQILHDILLKALQASEVVQIRPCVADKTLDVWYTIFPDSRVSFSHFSVGAHCMKVLVSQLSCMVLRWHACDHVRTGVFLTFRCATNSLSCFRLRQRLLKVHFPRKF